MRKFYHFLAIIIISVITITLYSNFAPLPKNSKMAQSIHQFTVKDAKGNDIDLSTYKGKVLLIVNTASKCGFTPQLEGMEEVYEAYKEQGFEVLAFPSNDFAGQEPLEGVALEEFCMAKYDASYKIFDKVKVKGKEVCDLYKFLSDKKLNGNVNSTPKWNFHKYLIDKEGKVRDYYYTTTKPTAGRVKRHIEKLLAE